MSFLIEPAERPNQHVKIALVTGAASGIGAAAAERLATDGATVVCADIQSDGAIATARRLSSGYALTLDVSSEVDWQSAMKQISRDIGRLDWLVNSAGVAQAGALEETSIDDWRRVFSINLDGVFLGTKHAIAVMKERGGAIVYVASASGIRMIPGAAAYSTSKAAVRAFTRAAAKECRQNKYPIRINCVTPGGVRTPIWSKMPFFGDLIALHGNEDAAYRAMEETGGSRFAQPSEIAAAIAFLLSDDAHMATGSELVIDDGFIL